MPFNHPTLLGVNLGLSRWVVVILTRDAGHISDLKNRPEVNMLKFANLKCTLHVLVKEWYVCANWYSVQCCWRCNYSMRSGLSHASPNSLFFHAKKCTGRNARCIWKWLHQSSNIFSFTLHGLLIINTLDLKAASDILALRFEKGNFW